MACGALLPSTRIGLKPPAIGAIKLQEVKATLAALNRQADLSPSASPDPAKAPNTAWQKGSKGPTICNRTDVGTSVSSGRRTRQKLTPSCEGLGFDSAWPPPLSCACDHLSSGGGPVRSSSSLCGVSRWFTPLACGPGSLELSTSYSNMAIN